MSELLTWENIVIVAAVVEMGIGALPNKWIPHKSFIIRILNALNESGKKSEEKSEEKKP